jgi:HEAT repeat protein
MRGVRPARGSQLEELQAQTLCDLVTNLAAKSPVIRQNARRRLVGMGATAVPCLTNLLNDPRTHVRWEAAKTLGQIADPRSAPALLAALEDKDADVRWLSAAAIANLGRLGLRLLLQRLQDNLDSSPLLEATQHVCWTLTRRRAIAPAARRILQAFNEGEPDLSLAFAIREALTILRSGSQAPGSAMDQPQKARSPGPETEG